MRVPAWVPSLLFILLATPINGGVLKVADLHQFWNESGITKDLVNAAISNARCFTTNETLAACRAAIAAAKKEIDSENMQWVDDDFNSVVDQIDQGAAGQVSKEWLYGEMMNAYVNSFDAHGSFLPAASYEAAVGPDSDVYTGVGLKIMSTDAGVFVRAVVPNSPADAAGLKPYDILRAINGVAVGVGAQGHRNMDMIKGEQGDVIEFTVERKGVVKLVKVPIGIVPEQNITAPEFISFGGHHYAFIHLQQFKAETCDKLKEKIRALPSNIAGLMLDLRDNPGGVVEQGICVAGLFVGKKDIVGRKAVPLNFPLPTSFRPPPDGVIDWSPNYREASFPDLPLIVLINQNSASAAEIVTGALQDYKQAWIVGDNSFGKGSVQTLEPMPGNSNFYVGYTTALFYRPNGTTNQLAGVTPDFKVPLRRTATPAERRAPREGDIYPNSLQPLEAHMRWTETRPEADYIRRCVESTAVDLTANEMIAKRTGSEDYQKAYALGVFDCTVGAGAKHNPSSRAKRVAIQK